MSAPEPESGYRLQMKRGGDLRRDGKLDAARAAFEEAARIAPASGAAHFNLALVLRDAGEAREAVLRFRTAARLDRRDFDAMQNVVLTIAAAVREGRTLFRGGAPVPASVKAPGTGVSVIVCSIDPGRLARFRVNVEGHLLGREHEIIAIGDARSLSEGYGRGLAQARHEIVVFSHDDVELVSGDPFGELEAALGRHDLVGLVGSRLATGPAVLWAGHPHVHGWIIGFDAATFDGFHFYDLDFTYRAHRSGLSLAVTTGIEAIHQSEGKFEDTWRHYAQRFHAKFPELNAARAPAHWYGAQFSKREELAAFYAELRALGSQP